MSHAERAKKLLKKYCEENNLNFNEYRLEECASWTMDALHPVREQTSFEVYKINNEHNKPTEIYIALKSDGKFYLRDGVNPVCCEE